MNDLGFEVQRLKRNIEKLLKGHNKLREEKQTLEKQIVDLRRQLEEAEKKIEELKDNNINLHSTATFGSDKTGNEELKRKLEELINEIDESLSLLNAKRK